DQFLEQTLSRSERRPLSTVEHAVIILEMNHAAQAEQAEDRTDCAFAWRHDRSQKQGLGKRPNADGEQRCKSLHPTYEIGRGIEQHPLVVPDTLGQLRSTPQKKWIKSSLDLDEFLLCTGV